MALLLDTGLCRYDGRGKSIFWIERFEFQWPDLPSRRRTGFNLSSLEIAKCWC